ncbi:uncharacterized protein LOC121377041 [Gigantopelta aegis]|uniref:uncharacterized protein LOC121377041 n=1 Tax=Gigantopelta aegis TaxID=1735272 RepID=UPI001B88E222|nr:uncharacterized protein LOC121377041 [Gigantopelta aegis]
MGFVTKAVLFLVASTHILTSSVIPTPWPMPPNRDFCGDTETFTATTRKQTMKSSYSLVLPSEQFSCRWVFRAFNPRLPIHLEIRPAFIYRSYNCSLMTTVKDGNAELRSFCEGQPGWMGWRRRISFTGYSGSMTVLLKSKVQRKGFMMPIKIKYYQDKNDPLLTTTTARPTTTTTAWPKWITTTWPEFITTTWPEFTMPPADHFALCGNTSLIAFEVPGYIYTPGVQDSFKSHCLWVIRPFWFGPIHLEIRSVSGYDLDCNDQQLLITDGTKTIKRHCDGNPERYTGTEGTMRIMYRKDGFYPFTSQISIKYYQDKYYDRPDSDSRTKDDLLVRHVATISSVTGAIVLVLFVVILITALFCRYRRNRSRRSANRTLTLAVISDGRTDKAPPAYIDLFPTKKVLTQSKDEITNDPSLPEPTTSALPYSSAQTEPALVNSAKPESNI